MFIKYLQCQDDHFRWRLCYHYHTKAGCHKIELFTVLRGVKTVRKGGGRWNIKMLVMCNVRSSGDHPAEVWKSICSRATQFGQLLRPTESGLPSPQHQINCTPHSTQINFSALKINSFNLEVDTKEIILFIQHLQGKREPVTYLKLEIIYLELFQLRITLFCCRKTFLLEADDSINIWYLVFITNKRRDLILWRLQYSK